MAESQVERIMRNLKCSKEEAEQIIADDKAIDRGERMAFDLSPEAEKQAKKYANTGTRQTASITAEEQNLFISVPTCAPGPLQVSSQQLW